MVKANEIINIRSSDESRRKHDRGEAHIAPWNNQEHRKQTLQSLNKRIKYKESINTVNNPSNENNNNQSLSLEFRPQKSQRFDKGDELRGNERHDVKSPSWSTDEDIENADRLLKELRDFERTERRISRKRTSHKPTIQRPKTRRGMCKDDAMNYNNCRENSQPQNEQRSLKEKTVANKKKCEDKLSSDLPYNDIELRMMEEIENSFAS